MLHHVAPHFILIFIQASVSRIHRQIPLNAPLDFDRAGLPSLWEIWGGRKKLPGELDNDLVGLRDAQVSSALLSIDTADAGEILRTLRKAETYSEDVWG